MAKLKTRAMGIVALLFVWGLIFTVASLAFWWLPLLIVGGTMWAALLLLITFDIATDLMAWPHE